MKPRWMAAAVAVVGLSIALPGATQADRPFHYFVEAGCMDGGRGPQFMDLSGAFPTLEAWRQLVREIEEAAMPDSGEVDGICNPDSVQVFHFEKVVVRSAGDAEGSIEDDDTAMDADPFST